eukprot:SAG22_NODE_4405_length_1281_cov_0.866328_1_plen_148_part_10
MTPSQTASIAGCAIMGCEWSHLAATAPTLMILFRLCPVMIQNIGKQEFGIHSLSFFWQLTIKTVSLSHQSVSARPKPVLVQKLHRHTPPSHQPAVGMWLLGPHPSAPLHHHEQDLREAAASHLHHCPPHCTRVSSPLGSDATSVLSMP